MSDIGVILESNKVKEAEQEFDAALADMVPLTKVTLAIWCQF